MVALNIRAVHKVIKTLWRARRAAVEAGFLIPGPAAFAIAEWAVTEPNAPRMLKSVMLDLTTNGSYMTHKLEKLGLIVRAQSQNRRCAVFVLTAAGIALGKHVAEAIGEEERR